MTDRPLVLIRVYGGIAEEWYTAAGVGTPDVHILDFDRGDEGDEETASFVTYARTTLRLFAARGVDTSDLTADLDALDRELTFDEAEAAGLDGTGRDLDPRFPYHLSDLKGTDR